MVRKQFYGSIQPKPAPDRIATSSHVYATMVVDRTRCVESLASVDPGFPLHWLWDGGGYHAEDDAEHDAHDPTEYHAEELAHEEHDELAHEERDHELEHEEDEDDRETNLMRDEHAEEHHHDDEEYANPEHDEDDKETGALHENDSEHHDTLEDKGKGNADVVHDEQSRWPAQRVKRRAQAVKDAGQPKG